MLLDHLLRELLYIAHALDQLPARSGTEWRMLIAWLRGQRRVCEVRLAAIERSRAAAGSTGSNGATRSRDLETIAVTALALGATAVAVPGEGPNADGVEAFGCALGDALARHAATFREAHPDGQLEVRRAESRASIARALTPTRLPSRVLDALAGSLDASMAAGEWNGLFVEGAAPCGSPSPLGADLRVDAAPSLAPDLVERLRPVLRLQGSAIAADVAAVYSEPAGKLLRGRLTTEFARLCGAPSDRAMAVATAVEQVHLASTVVDDVIDRSPLRHGRPTLVARHGPLVALQVGRYLAMTSVPLILVDQPPALFDELRATIARMIDGELHEVTDGALPSWSAYRDTIDRKSAALFAFACRAGALAAGAAPHLAEAAGALGREIGFAFQIVDDGLDYFGTEKIGKVIGTDFRAGIFTRADAAAGGDARGAGTGGGHPGPAAHRGGAVGAALPARRAPHRREGRLHGTRAHRARTPPARRVSDRARELRSARLPARHQHRPRSLTGP